MGDRASKLSRVVAMCLIFHILGQRIIVLWSGSGTISTFGKRKIRTPPNQAPLDSTIFPILSLKCIVHLCSHCSDLFSTKQPKWGTFMIPLFVKVCSLLVFIYIFERKLPPRAQGSRLLGGPEDFEKINWDEYDGARPTRPRGFGFVTLERMGCRER